MFRNIIKLSLPSESARIKNLMKESAQSRLYAEVHFKVDNDEGLRLGRQIGRNSRKTNEVTKLKHHSIRSKIIICDLTTMNIFL